MRVEDRQPSPVEFIAFSKFFSSRRRHTRCLSDWSSDVCSSDLRKGDRVDIEMPMALAAEPFADEPGVQAFLYGPMVLAGDLGNEGLMDALVNNQQGPAVAKIPMSVPELR